MIGFELSDNEEDYYLTFKVPWRFASGMTLGKKYNIEIPLPVPEDVKQGQGLLFEGEATC